jgi:hypothetical protein
MVNTTEFSQALRPGIRKWYGDEATRLSKKSVDFIPLLYNVDNSDKAYEEISEIIGLGLFTELTEGNAIDYDSFKKGRDFKLIHTDFSKGFRVTRKMMRDEQYGLISRMTKGLSRAAHKTVRYKAMLPLALGFGAGTGTWNTNAWAATTETYVLGDAKPVFDDAHPIQNPRSVGTYALPSTWSNYANTALSDSAILTAVTAVKTQPDENGFVEGYQPDILFVPSALYYTALNIVDSKSSIADNKNSGVTNEVNRLGIRVVEIPELPDIAGWYLASSAAEREAYWFWREKPGKVETDKDFNTKDSLWSMIFSASCGFANGKGLYGAGV